VDDNVHVVMDEFAIYVMNLLYIYDEFARYMCMIFCVATCGRSKLGSTFGCCFPSMTRRLTFVG
jgi:hypothetical protein